MEYDVSFSFTTIHPKSRFVGRHGTINVTTELAPDDLVKDEDLPKAIRQFILSKKPSYKILMVTIDNVKEVA